jgi:uncharacterized membrane protein
MPHRLDEQGRLRVWAEPVSFESLVDEAVEPIRAQAIESRAAAVCERLAMSLACAAAATSDAARRRVLQARADAAAAAARDVCNTRRAGTS